MRSLIRIGRIGRPIDRQIDRQIGREYRLVDEEIDCVEGKTR